ncbi:hypothetical protein BRADI_2g35215v3 [Brachypodium distachyon]|uniref:Uncharacterized protein n=1 Tax=Brachypodium distachyon TaxID=15368 RepID=A0A2K2DBW6_BRADI|nr:hypothetical protein BRADI_2g35215v3 [Brachypodium distachyon]
MAERVYSNALKRVEGESETLKLTVGEEEIIFQNVYKETTGTKPTKVLGCGYLATYPSKTQVLQEKFDRQAREVEHLKERLAKEAADREASREELKNSLREELTKESNAIMAKNMELALVQKNTPTTINLTAAATTGNDANKNVPAADEDRNDLAANGNTNVPAADEITSETAANGNTNVPAADEITSETAANGNTNESAAKKNTIDATTTPHTADTLQKTAPTTIDAAEPPDRSTEETTEDAPPPTNEARPPQTSEKLQETLPLNIAGKKNRNGKFAKCSKGLFKGDGKDGANVAPNAYISSQQLFQHAKTRSALTKMKKQMYLE